MTSLCVSTSCYTLRMLEVTGVVHPGGFGTDTLGMSGPAAPKVSVTAMQSSCSGFVGASCRPTQAQGGEALMDRGVCGPHVGVALCACLLMLIWWGRRQMLLACMVWQHLRMKVMAIRSS